MMLMERVKQVERTPSKVKNDQLVNFEQSGCTKIYYQTLIGRAEHSFFEQFTLCHFRVFIQLTCVTG
jgi:hypothetical protein